jgi:hypothetical protein
VGVPEWESYNRSRAKFRPIGPELEIARDADWSVTVSRAQDGFRIAHARSDGGSGVSLGQLPGPSSRSKHIVNVFAHPASRKGGTSLIAGLFTADVARVEVKLRDGTTLSVRTEAAPDALEADLRTLVIKAPVDEEPVGPGFPPFVLEYVLFASDDTIVERLTNSRRPRRT